MSSRHTRRKAAKVKAEAKLVALATAEKSRRVSEIVRKNKAAPIERNYYPVSSMAGFAGRATHANIAPPRLREIRNEFLKK